jgi:cobalamin biosynthesis protein CobT
MAISRIEILRNAVVKITQIIAGQGIKVTQSGVNAFVQSDTTGRPVRVNLPYIPDNADEALINAIQGFLDHEVAHILFSDFTLLGKGNEEGVMSYLNTLEDPRIEICMTKKFEGSAWNLEKVGEFFLERFTTPAYLESMAASNTKKAIMVLMVPAVRAWAGQKLYQEYMSDKWFIFDGVKKALGDDLISRIGKMESSQDAYEIAVLMKAALEKPAKKGGDGETPEDKGSGAESTDKKATSDDTDSDSTGETSGMTAETSSEDDVSEKEGEEDAETKDAKPKDPTKDDDAKEEDGDKSAEGRTSEASDAEDDTEESSDKRSEGSSSSDDTDDKEGEASDEATGSSGEGATFAPDEFDKEMEKADFEAAISGAIAESTIEALRDSQYLVYSKDEDIIEPLKLKHWHDDYLTDLQSKVDHLVAPLQKDLERAIVARSYSSWTSGHRSGRLCSANLARLAVNDTRVFRRKHENQSKDVAVSIVIDCSGSMTSNNRIYTAAQAAYAIASVLDRLQISHEVIGFTTDGRYGDDRAKYKSPTAISEEEVREAEAKLGREFSRYDRIYMPVVKGFNERMTVETKKRFAFLPHIRLSQNVDGECLEVAARRLMQRRETGKIIMVLSDGEPCCSGGGRQQRDNLIKVVKQIEESGTKIVGIGIESNSVERYYKRNVVLNEIADLPLTVVRELKDMLLN